MVRKKRTSPLKHYDAGAYPGVAQYAVERRVFLKQLVAGTITCVVSGSQLIACDEDTATELDGDSVVDVRREEVPELAGSDTTPYYPDANDLEDDDQESDPSDSGEAETAPIELRIPSQSEAETTTGSGDRVLFVLSFSTSNMALAELYSDEGFALETVAFALNPYTCAELETVLNQVEAAVAVALLDGATGEGVPAVGAHILELHLDVSSCAPT